jgi:beta-phosphoglucomutase-like phosphatase (HAD superfamily)
MPTPVTHVIYDLDGTLLDTEPMFIEATNAIFARFGRTLPPEVRALMIGRSSRIAVPLMLERTGLPISTEAFIEERKVMLFEQFPLARPMPGALELTAHLAMHGVRQAVATSSSRAALARKVLGHPEWFASFEAVVNAEDVERSKPAPDIFLEAARRIGASPELCLVFEDAPAGIEAALAAGMHVIAVPESEHRGLDAMAQACEVIESLEAFDLAAWGLPARA